MALSRFPHASAQAIAEFFAADLVEPLTLQSSGTAMSQSNGRILMCALWSRTRWRTKPVSFKAYADKKVDDGFWSVNCTAVSNVWNSQLRTSKITE